jgi:DNA-directed RNA polymerase subunit RPC12/RpoP
MKILDMLLGREHGVTESAVLAANATTKPTAGWAKAIDAAGTFCGFRYVCEKCGSDFVLQGIAIMRTGQFDCQCGHRANLDDWMSANGLTEEKLPTRHLVARRQGPNIRLIGGGSGDEIIYETDKLASVGWLRS